MPQTRAQNASFSMSKTVVFWKPKMQKKCQWLRKCPNTHTHCKRYQFYGNSLKKTNENPSEKLANNSIKFTCDRKW